MGESALVGGRSAYICNLFEQSRGVFSTPLVVASIRPRTTLLEELLTSRHDEARRYSDWRKSMGNEIAAIPSERNARASPRALLFFSNSEMAKRVHASGGKCNIDRAQNQRQRRDERGRKGEKSKRQETALNPLSGLQRRN